ncbi:MAG TPA: YibE/F family protein [Pilimelia sp.]|nr:YibE/F family protein [Pilimelia sp.]
MSDGWSTTDDLDERFARYAAGRDPRDGGADPPRGAGPRRRPRHADHTLGADPAGDPWHPGDPRHPGAHGRHHDPGHRDDRGHRQGHHHGHRHHHDHGDHPSPPAPRSTVRLLVAVLVPIALATVAALVWLWPGEVTADRQDPAGTPQRLAGEVVAVVDRACPRPPEGEPPGAPPGPTRCGTVTVRLAEGPERGAQVETDLPSGPGAPTVRAGERVVLLHLPDALGDRPYQIVDHQRAAPLAAVVLAFALAVVAFGRWRGVRALAGLGITFSVLLLFVVPAILDGRPPLLVAVVGSGAIMLSVLFLTHGFRVTTAMAVLGTLASLTLTGLLSAAATWLTRLTGVASEEAAFVTMFHQDVNMQGLLLAGILIGSLGVLDDVCVTQAAAVTELGAANPGLGVRRIYRAATRIGRAHIASVINTIILAYAGASLPVLILLTTGGQPLGELLASQFLAEEIVRSAVGTIGLISAVPITTALAALALRRGARQRPRPAGGPSAGAP